MPSRDFGACQQLLNINFVSITEFVMLGVIVLATVGFA